MALKVGELFAEASMDTSGFTSGVSTLTGSIKGFSKKATAALAGVTAAVGALGGAIGMKAVGSAMKFEKAMAGVKAATNASEKEMDILTQRAEELGKSSKFMMTEIANAEKALAKSGYAAEETADAMDGVVSAAAASGEPLKEVAVQLTNVVKGYGLAADETGRVADVFAEAARSSNVTINSLAEGMKFLAPVAKDMGLSLEQATSMMGSLGDAGIAAGMAGRQLRTAFLDFQKLQVGDTTKRAKKSLKKFGVKVEDVANMSFMELITKMREAGATAGDFATVFTKRASSALVKLSDSAGDLGGLNKKLEKSKGSAEEMAQTKLDTLSGQFDVLQGSIDNMFQSLGEDLIPKLQTFLEDYAIPIVNKITDWIDEQKSLNDLFDKLSDVLGSETVENLKKIGKGLGSFFKTLGDVLGPTIKKMLPVINNLFQLLVDLLALDFKGAGGELKEYFKSIVDLYGTFFEKLIEKTGLQKLVKGIEKAIKGIKKLLNKIPGVSFDIGVSELSQKKMDKLTKGFTTKEGMLGRKDIIDPGDVKALRNTFSKVDMKEKEKLGLMETLINKAHEAVKSGTGNLKELGKGISRLAKAFPGMTLGGIDPTKQKAGANLLTRFLPKLSGQIAAKTSTKRTFDVKVLEGAEIKGSVSDQELNKMLRKIQQRLDDKLRGQGNK